MRFSAFLLLSLLALPVSAHELHHAIEPAVALSVRVSYADGQPFAFEAFEAYPEGQDIPAQVGRTDGQGRAVFVPGAVKRWRLKAFTADGHGLDIRFEAPVVATVQGTAVATEAGPNRASLLLFGLSLLLSGFGVYQLWLRKKR